MQKGKPHDLSIDIWLLGQLAYKLTSKPSPYRLPHRIVKENDDDAKA